MKRENTNTSLFVICMNIFCFWSLSHATVINLEDSKYEELSESGTNLQEASKFDIEKFVTDHGYPFEKHPVTTEDGYNLEMHRIPHGRNVSSSSPANSPPVLMMHDILGTSADFLISGPENSLALQLADQGYDVWLGNNRGNTYSRSHETMSPSNKSFWNFSFQELGVYDDTVMIDYIYNISQKTNISCLGYSQGATQFFVMLSEKPEYNKKITVLFTMAPLVYMKNSYNNIFRLLADHYDAVEDKEHLLLDLFKVVVDRRVHSEKFNHRDFVFNGEAVSLLNYWVINDLNEHNNKIHMTTTTVSTSSLSTSRISSSTPESTTHHGSSSRSLSSSLFYILIIIFFTITRDLMT